MASLIGTVVPWTGRRRAAASAGVLAALLTLGAVLLPAVPAAAASHAVMIHNYAYSPASLSIAQGDTVTWTNMDTAEHDVVVTSGPASFRSPMLSKGESWSYTFKTPGSYSYTCSVHPDMRGTVTAQAAAPPPAPSTTQPAPAQQQQQQQQAPPAASQPSAAAVPAAPTSTAPGAKGKAGAQAAVSPAPAPAPAVAAAPEQPAASLNPLLLVAGASVAVVVFCLLLMASRPQPVPAPAEAPAEAPVEAPPAESESTSRT
jgi:plastocyanin